MKSAHFGLADANGDVWTGKRVAYRSLEELLAHSGGDGGIGSVLIHGDNPDALKARLPF